MKGIGREYVISVEGILRQRSEDTVNPKIATGEVEVKIDSLTVLSTSLSQLPFEIGESTMTREDIRLKHRFLDPGTPLFIRISSCAPK